VIISIKNWKQSSLWWIRADTPASQINQLTKLKDGLDETQQIAKETGQDTVETMFEVEEALATASTKMPYNLRKISQIDTNLVAPQNEMTEINQPTQEPATQEQEFRVNSFDELKQMFEQELQKR
jgi:hypothetical protein